MVKIHFLAYFAFCFVITCLPSVAMNNFLGGLIVFVFLWAIGIFYIIRYESIKNKKSSFITRFIANFIRIMPEILKTMWDILLLLLYGAWLLVYYFFYFIAGIAGIIGLISGIIGFFGLF